MVRRPGFTRQEAEVEQQKKVEDVEKGDVGVGVIGLTDLANEATVLYSTHVWRRQA